MSVELNNLVASCQRAGNKQCEHILLINCWNSIGTSLMQVCYNLCVFTCVVGWDRTRMSTMWAENVQNHTSEMGAAASTSTCFIPESDADSPVSAWTDIKRRPRYETPSPYTQLNNCQRQLLQHSWGDGLMWRRPHGGTASNPTPKRRGTT
jgi:hypothetical protein